MTKQLRARYEVFRDLYESLGLSSEQSWPKYLKRKRMIRESKVTVLCTRN